MRRSALLGSLALIATVACSDIPSRNLTEGSRPPNIILLLADDLGQGDLRAYDPNSRIPTPNIDRLAEQGVRFTDAHSPSAVCTPTRYSILTGRYAWRTRLKSRVLKPFDPPLIETDRLTLPALLRHRGYATAAIGKWHLGMNLPTIDGSGFARMQGRQMPRDADFSAAIQGGPLDRGFDTYFGAQLVRARGFVRNRHFVNPLILRPAGRRAQAADWDETQKGPIQLTEALAQIDRFQASDPSRPFFLYFATQVPHTPYVPATQIAGAPVAGTSGAGPRGDLVVELDATLGQLVQRLEELGIADDTLIILTSDNGPEVVGETHGHDPAGGWRGEKGDLWEGGHRVPFIARWGDGTEDGSVIAPGGVNDQLIGLQDLMATVAGLVMAPLSPDDAEDSASFLPALLGKPSAQPPREHLVHHSAKGHFAIRRGDWKLIRGRPVATDDAVRWTESALFNLTTDPREMTNLYQDHPEIVAELTILLNRDLRAGRSAQR